MTGTRHRVAIVGAGPAGAFAADRLLRARGDVEIDLFERLPTPWGLLRAGVAPDHQEIKRLDETFDRETLGRGCRLFGNVTVGEDLSHDELMNHYTAVIYATGAQTDKSLGIPGEDLPGSWPATEFVAWYNGHPDYRDLEFDLSSPRAVVIGNGNVAADVTRMLTLSPEELERTDVADHALEALRDSQVEEVVVLGRRGPAQAAFTSAELRELGRLDGVDVRVDPAEIELDPLSSRWLAERGTFTARKNVELLREFAARPPRADVRRTIVLRFLRSPLEIRGDGRVEAIDVGRNEIVEGDDGSLRPRARGRSGRDDRVRARPAVRRLPRRSPAGRALRRAQLHPPEQAGPGAGGGWGTAARRLRGRLDQARSDRHPRHEQARRRGDRPLPRRGPRRGRSARSRIAGRGRDRGAPRRAPARPRHRRRVAGDRYRRAPQGPGGAAAAREARIT